MESKGANNKEKTINYWVTSRIHPRAKVSTYNDPSLTAEQANEVRDDLSKEEMAQVNFAGMPMLAEHNGDPIGTIERTFAGDDGLYALQCIRGDTERGREMQRKISSGEIRENSTGQDYELIADVEEDSTTGIKKLSNPRVRKSFIECSITKKGARNNCDMLHGVPFVAGSKEEVLFKERILNSKALREGTPVTSLDLQDLFALAQSKREQNQQQQQTTSSFLSSVRSFNTDSNAMSSVEGQNNAQKAGSNNNTAAVSAAAATTTTTTATTTPQAFTNNVALEKLSPKDHEKVTKGNTPEQLKSMGNTQQQQQQQSTPGSTNTPSIDFTNPEDVTRVLQTLSAELERKEQEIKTMKAETSEYQKEKRIRLAEAEQQSKQAALTLLDEVKQRYPDNFQKVQESLLLLADPQKNQDQLGVRNSLTVLAGTNNNFARTARDLEKKNLELTEALKQKEQQLQLQNQQISDFQKARSVTQSLIARPSLYETLEKQFKNATNPPTSSSNTTSPVYTQEQMNQMQNANRTQIGNVVQQPSNTAERLLANAQSLQNAPLPPQQQQQQQSQQTSLAVNNTGSVASTPVANGQQQQQPPAQQPPAQQQAVDPAQSVSVAAGQNNFSRQFQVESQVQSLLKTNSEFANRAKRVNVDLSPENALLVAGMFSQHNMGMRSMGGAPREN